MSWWLIINMSTELSTKPKVEFLLKLEKFHIESGTFTIYTETI